MKKRLLIMLIGIFIIGVVNGAESNTQTNFTISGCDFGETGLPVGNCSSDGDYFCSYEEGSYILYDTIDDPTGCSKGLATHIVGQPFCCPTGYFCDNDNDGGPICNLRTEDCSDQLTRGSCEAIGCYWLEGICIESLSDYGCDIYQDSVTCTEDRFGLGKTGVGTAICGTFFTVDTVGYVVPFDSCRCEWDSVCKLAYDMVEEFSNENKFKCLKSFGIGECINGTQLITWNATYHVISGYLPSGIVPPSVLEAGKCVTNVAGTERSCGMSPLKLVGFTFFSFFISLGMIGLFYFLKELKNQHD